MTTPSSPSSTISTTTSTAITSCCIFATCSLLYAILSPRLGKRSKDYANVNDKDSKDGSISDSMSYDEILWLRQKHTSASVSLSYSNTAPLLIVGGSKAHLIDANNIRYLDTRNNVAHCGHNHPSIIQAIQNQVQRLNTNTRYLHPHLCLLASRLASLFPKSSHLSKVFFVNSGSEANDLALRLARAYTKGTRNTIVVEGGYHGHTLGTLEVSPYKYEQSGEFAFLPDKSKKEEKGEEEGTEEKNDAKEQEPLKNSEGHGGKDELFPSPTPSVHRRPYVRQVPCPNTFRGLHRVHHHHHQNQPQSSASSPSNTAPTQTPAQAYANYVKQACLDFGGPGHVSAFIVESGMSVAGVILPPRGYLSQAVKYVRECGGVYIADEVQVGFGRLGVCMWGFQYHPPRSDDDDDDDDEANNYGEEQDENDKYDEEEEEEEMVTPDIVTVGKPFGNGMPLAAVITTPTIAEHFESMNVEYFNTFGGNPVCCAAGLAMLQVLQDEHLQENAKLVGDYLMERLKFLQETHYKAKLTDDYHDCHGSGGGPSPIMIGDVRGSGLFVGIEFVTFPPALQPATLATSFLCTVLKDKHRILTSIDGPDHNVLVVKPPMVFSKENVDEFVTALDRVMTVDYMLSFQGKHVVRGGQGHTPT